MVVALIMIGIFFGVFAAIFAGITGYSILMCLIFYAVSGAVSVLGTAIMLAARMEKHSDVSVDAKSCG
ncbi:hypothetical protein FDP25_09475 [Roseovarius sp. A21]|uniref:Uncharacterized protein n=1 Tax=Roseovarius bejariae TaxID=2576383 RepID=A0A844CUE8_9RHOB|nr:hypothetical protein [Roseovarius bejariae]MRU15659.1 hypothetical protein [Roseovarius bejariae]